MRKLCEQGAKAFLDKESHNEGAGGSSPLVPGAVIDVLITKTTDKRLVRVTTNPDSVAAAVSKEWPGLTIGEVPNFWSSISVSEQRGIKQGLQRLWVLLLLYHGRLKAGQVV